MSFFYIKEAHSVMSDRVAGEVLLTWDFTIGRTPTQCLMKAEALSERECEELH